MSVLLRIAYDGTEFRGYAPQPGQRTVQGVLEEHLRDLFFGATIDVRGASRTDAGVHAHGQLVAFDKTLPIPPEGILKGLNGRLPADVAVLAAWEETRPDDVAVEPRFENGGKHYRYQLVRDSATDPFRDRFTWRLDQDLDVDRMRDAARDFIGTHDFLAFRARDCQATNTMRTMTRVDVRVCEVSGLHGDTVRSFVIDVEGQAFLKRLVRVMAGTLVEIGRGHLEPSAVARALHSGVRSDAGATAPARGLSLIEVKWPGSRTRS
jgi:tRNA pseudouridine38-40 synthase